MANDNKSGWTRLKESFSRKSQETVKPYENPVYIIVIGVLNKLDMTRPQETAFVVFDGNLPLSQLATHLRFLDDNKSQAQAAEIITKQSATFTSSELTPIDELDIYKKDDDIKDVEEDSDEKEDVVIEETTLESENEITFSIKRPSPKPDGVKDITDVARIWRFNLKDEKKGGSLRIIPSELPTDTTSVESRSRRRLLTLVRGLFLTGQESADPDKAAEKQAVDRWCSDIILRGSLSDRYLSNRVRRGLQRGLDPSFREPRLRRRTGNRTDDPSLAGGTFQRALDGSRVR